MKRLADRAWTSARSLAKNRYFWAGLGVLALGAGVLYIALDALLMPLYTRHGVSLGVPEVLHQPVNQAVATLEEHDLEVVTLQQRFNPNFPPDVVIDQDPAPNAPVKPGRTVFLMINSGRQTKVTLPSLEGLSLREAENRLTALGLRLEEALPDSIPHPHRNTVTRQSPPPGDSLAEGAGVRLWFSTGLGNQFASVPDVTGMTVAEAERMLLENRLRSVVIGGSEVGDTDTLAVVQRQGREAGTRVPEGFEIRLYLEEALEGPGSPDGLGAPGERAPEEGDTDEADELEE